jgi:arsenate reductase
MTKIKILVLCTGNSARSQIGEGLFRAAGGAGVDVFSAGVKPSSVRPEAIAVMQEIGIDISGQRSKSVDEFAGQSMDYVVTVCDNARDACPLFPAGTARLHWSLQDPAAAPGNEIERLEAFRGIRDQLRKLVKGFLADRVG